VHHASVTSGVGCSNRHGRYDTHSDVSRHGYGTPAAIDAVYAVDRLDIPVDVQAVVRDTIGEINAVLGAGFDKNLASVCVWQLG